MIATLSAFKYHGTPPGTKFANPVLMVPDPWLRAYFRWWQLKMVVRFLMAQGYDLRQRRQLLASRDPTLTNRDYYARPRLRNPQPL